MNVTRKEMWTCPNCDTFSSKFPFNTYFIRNSSNNSTYTFFPNIILPNPPSYRRVLQNSTEEFCGY